jgi:hypothetical protein
MIAALLAVVILAALLSPLAMIGRVEGDEREPIRLRRHR